MPAKKTISDVARSAGVGVGTVSRVINDARGVSPAMKQRVLAVMERIGYAPPLPESRPGPRRRVAAAGVRPAIELINMFRLGLGWMADQAPVYARAMDGIETAATAAGMDLVVRQTESWEQLRDRPGSAPLGRIYFGTPAADDPPPHGLFAQPSVWMLGTPPDSFAGDQVQSDPLVAGQLAAQHLLRQRHACCAYLGTGPGTPHHLAGYRGDAFRFHLEQAGGVVHVAIDPGLVRVSKQANVVDEERLRIQLQRLLAATPAPTALFLQIDMLAPAAYRVLAELGIRPQRDLALVTCDNEPTYLRRLKPLPTVIDIQAEQLGTHAVQLLRWRRDHPEAPPGRMLIRPILRS